MPASKAQRAKTAQRRTQAVQLRLAGVDFETIADRLGYSSRGAAYTDITRALEGSLAELKHGADVLRHEELLRLNRLQAGLWSAALAGDTKSAETVLKIIDRRCRLLGLDAPQRHEVVTMSAIEAEIQRLTTELGEISDEEVPREPGGGELVGRPEAGPAA